MASQFLENLTTEKPYNGVFGPVKKHLNQIMTYLDLQNDIFRPTEYRGEKNDTQFRWKPLCIIPQNEQFRVTLIFER